MATRKDQKVEALIRMKRLGLHENAIREFKNTEKLNMSEPPFGALFWMDEKYQEAVKDFEKEFNCLAYHVAHNHTEFGEILTVLYVSSYEEEWLMDMNDLENGTPLCYVINLDTPCFSEFGHCQIVPVAGGVLRTA